VGSAAGEVGGASGLEPVCSSPVPGVEEQAASTKVAAATPHVPRAALPIREV
jgi:hypothetical protein